MNVITTVFGSIAGLMLDANASFSTLVNQITHCTAFSSIEFCCRRILWAVLQLHVQVSELQVLSEPPWLDSLGRT